MKRKKIKNLPEGKTCRCGICKKNQTTKQWVGIPHGGKSCCDECFEIEKQKLIEYYERTNRDETEAEFSISQRWGI